MPLISLTVTHFRNLQDARIQFVEGINYIHGVNGSGKTSLLEAIGYLGLGRSFRTNRHEPVVAHGQSKLVLFGQVQLDSQSHADDVLLRSLGFSRDLPLGLTEAKVDGIQVASLARLAREFPVSIIEPGSFEMLSGGPAKRRQFLDWAVFHVEHQFAEDWQKFQRIISQRNQLLRNARIDKSLLDVWNSYFLEASERITRLRSRVFDQILKALNDLLCRFDLTWAKTLAIDFSPGWDTRKSLAQLVEQGFEQERKVGHTLYGPNRADLRVKMDGRAAAEVLSRGQQKTLIILMKMAQVAVLTQAARKQCCFLIDDIQSELDEQHQRLLAQMLLAEKHQIFLTGLSPLTADNPWINERTSLKMFHVEQGKIRLHGYPS